MEKIIYYFFVSTIIGVCSATNPLARIVAGDSVDIKDYPYQVSIRQKKFANDPFKHICGGVIINKNNILTAAHCLVYNGGRQHLRVKQLRIYTGSSNLDNQGSFHNVTSFKLHPDYDWHTFHSDIAVVKLSKPIEFSDAQKPVELTSRPIENGMTGIVTGWGSTDYYFSLKPPKSLQKTTQTLIDYKKCQKMIEGVEDIEAELNESQICGYNENKRKVKYYLRNPSTCRGDSGGPIVADNKLIGIVSHGFKHECGTEDPSVFANVYALLGFVKENIGD